VLLLAMPGAFGLAWLIVVWVLAVAAAAIHLRWMSAPELLVGATFVALGWAAGLALPGVWVHAGAGPGALVLAGGLLYTAGAVCYRRRRPDPARRCSAITRFSMPSSALLQPASTLRSPGFSDNRPARAAGHISKTEINKRPGYAPHPGLGRRARRRNVAPVAASMWPRCPDGRGGRWQLPPARSCVTASLGDGGSAQL